MVTTRTVNVVGNPGQILGFTLAGNPGRKKVGSVAKTASKSHHSKPAGYGHSTKKNAGKSTAMVHRHGFGYASKPIKRNIGGGGVSSIGSTVTNALFVIAGALVSKLGAQAALGDNNTGVLGYFSNAVAGGILWFATSKLIKNKAASDGVVAGTIVQILLRMINDYTPFGSYVSQLGMGDYQVQSYVTPQVLVDPVNSATIRQPQGWGQAMMAPPPAVAAASAPSSGKSGMSGLYGGGGRGLY